MSTFVVRFVGSRSGPFRGMVRHVRSGEETAFGSSSELLSFFERMNATYRDGPGMESAIPAHRSRRAAASPVEAEKDHSTPS